MFGLNWPELMIISVVALIVIGPEDLPKMFRELGRFTAKLRQMSREFTRAMEQAAKETGVSDVARDLKTATSAKSMGLDAVKDSMDKFEKWDPLKNAAKPTTTMPARSLVPPPMPATPASVSRLTSVAERDAALMPSVEDEMAEDLADLEALDGPAQAPTQVTAHGPNTQALYDKAALRKQVLAEQTEKLKAIEAGTYAAPAEAPAKPKVAKAKAVAADAEPAAKPRRSRAKAETAPEAAEAAPEAATAKPAKPRAKKTKPSEDVA